MKSLRGICWLLAVIGVVVALLNYLYFWRLDPNAAAVLPATFALAGTLLGAAVTVESQTRLADIEHGREVDLSRQKFQQELDIFERARRQQLRLAALDNHLLVQQQAFAILHALERGEIFLLTFLNEYETEFERDTVDTVGQEALIDTILSRWYARNCLYLEKEVDSRLRVALEHPSDPEALHSAMSAIRVAMDLPPLVEV